METPMGPMPPGAQSRTAVQVVFFSCRSAMLILKDSRAPPPVAAWGGGSRGQRWGLPAVIHPSY